MGSEVPRSMTDTIIVTFEYRELNYQEVCWPDLLLDGPVTIKQQRNKFRNTTLANRCYAIYTKSRHLMLFMFPHQGKKN